MSTYTKAVIDGKTVWLPAQQEAIALPKPAVKKPKLHEPKRVGRRFRERTRWY